MNSKDRVQQLSSRYGQTSILNQSDSKMDCLMIQSAKNDHPACQMERLIQAIKLFQIITCCELMKLQESLLTETTKQSLIQVPLTDLPHQDTVKVFIQHHSRSLSVILPLHSKTVQALVREALEQLNHTYGVNLSMEPQEYSIYAARRNGKRCRDFPSLDDKQNILLTNLKCYCLVRKNYVVRDITYPLSQFNMEVQKKLEKKVKKNAACFCIF